MTDSKPKISEQSMSVMPSSFHTRFDLVSEESEFEQLVSELTRAHGFKSFAIISIPDTKDDRLQPKVLLTNWPREFLIRYDALGLMRNSGMFKKLRKTTVPMTWELADFSGTRPDDEVESSMELFREFGLTRGLFIPALNSIDTAATWTFDGDRPPMDEAEIAELALIVATAHETFGKIYGPSEKHSNLTGREIEALQWAADGKTSAEIAVIIALSENTINTYLNTAMRKLDCVNRTQLVAKALRLGLIK